MDVSKLKPKTYTGDFYKDHSYVRVNPRNGFVIFTAHYSLHPKSADPAWLREEKRMMTDAYWRREMELQYDALGGELIFPSYDPAVHLIEPFAIPKEWWKLRFIDYGHRNPTCCLWLAIDFEGNVYVYKEWYHPTYEQMQGSHDRVRRYTLKEHAAIINRMSKNEKYAGTFIDPQADEKNFANSDDKKTVLNKLADEGLVCAKAMKAGEGIDTIETMLRERKLYLFNNCVNTHSEKINYRWDEYTEVVQLGKNLKETPVKKNDHAMNCIKYAGNHFRNRWDRTPKPVVHAPPEYVRQDRTDPERAALDLKRVKQKRADNERRRQFDYLR